MNDAPEFFANVADAPRFREAIRRFDEENSRDPNTDKEAGVDWPRELLYARRLSNWVMKLRTDASEALRLASRCQHICRWKIPRENYPIDRVGYLRWRNELKEFHAQKAGEILRQVGYPEEMVTRVQDLNLKKNFPKDPESRVLEDALCLIFLEHQFAALARRTSADKMVNALQKSWKKMTPEAQAHALKLPYDPEERSLLERALGS